MSSQLFIISSVGVEPEAGGVSGLRASLLQYWTLCNGTLFQGTMIEENTWKFCYLQVEIIWMVFQLPRLIHIVVIMCACCSGYQ